MRELFVYYRVPAATAAAAHAAATAAQAALRTAHPGLVARLLRRDDGIDGRPSSATWMETYARPGIPSGVDEALQSAIESACTPLLALIDGPRHAEAFDADMSHAGIG